MRDASSEAEKLLDKFEIDRYTREDVYKTLLKVREAEKNLDKIDQRLLDKMILDFERNGLNLPKDKRDEYIAKQKKISDLCTDFSKNVRNDSTVLFFTKEELKGVSDDFLAGLTCDSGLYQISLQYPELFPVLQTAESELTRKKLNLAQELKCKKKNVSLFEEIIKLRHESAVLMGYKNHADYRLETRMAKNAATVDTFLTDLREKLKPFAKAELARFEKQKGGKIGLWDFRYYHFQRLKNEFKVDHDILQEYFPLDVVTKGMLEIYQTFLGLTFSKIPQDKATVWNDDVEMYVVLDSDTKEFLGHFYLDLFPRTGKYSHAACFTLKKPHKGADGKYVPAAAAMVANFTKPLADKPSLLKHSEVETFFHEFGHVMHVLCSRAIYSRFGGTSVERDFVEAPSQMLENWCWEAESLKMMSKHYKTGKEIPDELLQKLIASRFVDTGIYNSRQIFFGLADQRCHAGIVDDTGKLWKELLEETMLMQYFENANGIATFSHLTGGYDSQYYGYLYSLVFSADLFSEFKKGGILNPKLGRRYRDVILSRGGQVDSLDSIEEFLGRKPNQEAFLQLLGLK